jgi:hypothetical protein
MPEYRGFEYVTRPRGQHNWQWELYKIGATIGFDKGEIDGTREDAALCAQNAIEDWSEGTSENPGARLVRSTLPPWYIRSNGLNGWPEERRTRRNDVITRLLLRISRNNYLN